MKCPKCGREYTTRVRIRTRELVCSKCGYIGKIDNKGEKNEQQS